jgi:dipeptidyl aminopeptidase/acylaminoacyl peptidase
LICAAIEDAESTLGYLTLDGAWQPIWREQASILRWAGAPFSRSREGICAVVRGDLTRPAEVFTIAPDDGVATRLTDTNPHIAERELAMVETVRWQSFDGLEMHGLFVRPAGAQSRATLPTIVLVHGGPTGLWGYDFPGVRSMGWVQLLAAEGYAVFMPNPRGSMGFGTAFAEANNGDMGGGDWQDVIQGVDWCVAQGYSDPARLGLGGWSYGGYLTAWGVTQTSRFKAAVAGASITNWVSFHGVSTIPDFDAVFYDTDPFDWDGRYGQFSPMAHIRRTTTPTLLLHGERDPICPVGQAHEMFRALKELGVDTELVVYPREGHGPREREHLRDVLLRGVRWFAERV